jgi:hypothetical protein
VGSGDECRDERAGARRCIWSLVAFLGVLERFGFGDCSVLCCVELLVDGGPLCGDSLVQPGVAGDF